MPPKQKKISPVITYEEVKLDETGENLFKEFTASSNSSKASLEINGVIIDQELPKYDLMVEDSNDFKVLKKNGFLAPVTIAKERINGAKTLYNTLSLISDRESSRESGIQKILTKNNDIVTVKFDLSLLKKEYKDSIFPTSTVRTSGRNDTTAPTEFSCSLSANELNFLSGEDTEYTGEEEEDEVIKKKDEDDESSKKTDDLTRMFITDSNPPMLNLSESQPI